MKKRHNHVNLDDEKLQTSEKSDRLRKNSDKKSETNEKKKDKLVPKKKN